MKIIVLDGHAMNPGDLSWAGLEELGEVVVYERTAPEDLLDRMAGAEAAITNKVVFDAKTIAALPNLKYIGVTATGYNVVDTAAATAAGVTVTNVPAYSTDSVAQAAFALLLHLTNHAADLTADIAERWPTSPDFAYWREPIVELAGLTFGIVGYGGIGQRVAAIARAMGMHVIVTARASIIDDVEQVSLDDLFARADVVSLHCPLTDDTLGLVSAARIATMKPTAYLLNTGRGPLIDEQALANALADGTIAGAGLDVLSTEPPAADNPLLTAPRCVITPHVAWASAAARTRLLGVTVANVKAFAEGRPRNVVA